GPNLRVRNVVRIGEQIADKIWQRHGLLRARNEIDMIRREIDQHAASIEQICQDHRATPSALEMRSRQTYCWLKFLAGGDNLTSHLETLERVRKLIGEHRLPPSRPVHLHLIVMAALWRRREYQNALVIKVNMGYSYADQNLWRALIHNAVAERTAVNDNLVSEYAASDDFCELLFEIESLASPLSLPAKGRAHDLDESFERVNRGYFDGRMEKPKIVWNRTLTMRKFGHYQPGRDQLMLSLSLDDDKVAAYVIDFVMYHELLHKKHGSTAVNGRRQAHSPAFRADERRFAQFAEATYNLHQLALKHRRQ
ncbi:MAG: hypothetical protein J2P41_19330, partial [Blastocatellia bacterium]|nr:hypothetical protein [Blastocatellia bacterium]